MKRNCKTAAYAIIISLCLAMLSPVKAKANSAQREWHGLDSLGAIVKGDNCPVTVKGEKLTFDISGFSYTTNSGFVTAEYTFSNPSDLSAVMTVVFPFYGTAPDSRYEDNIAEQCGVTVNGEEIEKRLRVTFTENTNSFNADVDIPRLRDDYLNLCEITPDSPVGVYYYEVDAHLPIAEGNGSYSVTTDCSSIDSSKTRIYIPGFSPPYLSGYVEDNETITMYVIGEKPAQLPTFYLYDGWQKQQIAGELVLSEKSGGYEEGLTFKDLVLQGYEGKYSELDYYNAVIDYIQYRYATSPGIILKEFYPFDTVCWYEYELTVPAGGEVVNAVTAPMYPTINGRFDPEKYNYTYLLSPAKKWAGFGSFTCEIKTPYCLLESSLAFTKTQSGFEYSCEGLPDGELEFTLCEVENPKRVGGYGCLFALVMCAGYTCDSCFNLWR